MGDFDLKRQEEEEGKRQRAQKDRHVRSPVDLKAQTPVALDPPTPPKPASYPVVFPGQNASFGQVDFRQKMAAVQERAAIQRQAQPQHTPPHPLPHTGQPTNGNSMRDPHGHAPAPQGPPAPAQPTGQRAEPAPAPLNSTHTSLVSHMGRKLTNDELKTLRDKHAAGSLHWDVQAPAPGTKQTTMSMSDNGMAELAQYEGKGPNPYKDDQGYLTIGYGHLLDTNRDHAVSAAEWKAYDALGYPRKNLTEQQQLDLYKHDVQPRVDGVNGMLKGPVTQEIFDALVSLSFNIGLGDKTKPKSGGLVNSDIIASVNAGKFDAVPGQFLEYVHSRGKYSKGLENRRLKELTTFATPYEEGH